jgi:hypothetical protein
MAVLWAVVVVVLLVVRARHNPHSALTRFTLRAVVLRACLLREVPPLTLVVKRLVVPHSQLRWLHHASL